MLFGLVAISFWSAILTFVVQIAVVGSLTYVVQIAVFGSTTANTHALYSLCQVKNILPPNALRTLYYSLFHCHLVYAVEIWSNVPSPLLNPLVTKQKATIRLISNKPYNAHTEPLFKALSILPLSDLIAYAKLKFFHSFHYQTIPSTLNGTWHTTCTRATSPRW